MTALITDAWRSQAAREAIQWREAQRERDAFDRRWWAAQRLSEADCESRRVDCPRCWAPRHGACWAPTGLAASEPCTARLEAARAARQAGAA